MACRVYFCFIKSKNMIKIYPVTGLHCANCALNVEKTLKKQPGIANASVNFADSTARIEYENTGFSRCTDTAVGRAVNRL